MTRYIEYAGNRLLVEDRSLSIREITESMAEIYPEIRHAIVFEEGNTIRFVPREKMNQNLLDMELQRQKTQSHVDKILAAQRRKILESRSQMDILSDKIQAATIDVSGYGFAPGTHEEKMRELARGWVRPSDLSTPEPPSPYTVTIGDEYAARGGYEHLVGKKAKIIELNEDLEVYVVQVEDDDKEYVVRKKDIKQN